MAKKRKRKVRVAKRFDTGFVEGEPTTRLADELHCRCPDSLEYPYKDAGVSEHSYRQHVNAKRCACTLFETSKTVKGRSQTYKHRGKVYRSPRTKYKKIARSHFHVRYVALSGEVKN